MHDLFLITDGSPSSGKNGGASMNMAMAGEFTAAVNEKRSLVLKGCFSGFY